MIRVAPEGRKENKENSQEASAKRATPDFARPPLTTLLPPLRDENASSAEEEILVPIQLRGILTAEEIKAYRLPKAWRQAVDFGLVWLQIGIGVALFAWSPGILTYIIAAQEEA
jgi:hypothetical protein